MQNNNQPQLREQNNRQPIPEHHYEPINHEDPRPQNNEQNIARNRPERHRPVQEQRPQNTNLRSDGNFKNKNISNNMPMAG